MFGKNYKSYMIHFLNKNSIFKKLIKKIYFLIHIRKRAKKQNEYILIE
jgi:hypothetical protein